MIQWFVDWLGRLVQLGVDLMTALIGGILAAPLRAIVRSRVPMVVRALDAEALIDVRHQVLRQGQPREAAVLAGDDAPTTRHWAAVQADRVVGVVSVFAAPMPDDGVPQHQLRGMAVLPELQGSGIGGQLLAAAQADGRPLWCNARQGAVDFYASHGWHIVGEPFEIPGIGPHRRMWRPAADAPPGA